MRSPVSFASSESDMPGNSERNVITNDEKVRLQISDAVRITETELVPFRNHPMKVICCP